MDIHDAKYGSLFAQIETFKNQGTDWDSVRELNMLTFDMTIEMKVNIIRQIINFPTLTLDQWYAAVDSLKHEDEKLSTEKLGKDIKNNATISSNANSSWQLYKKRLEEKKFSKSSIRSIELSSIDVLQSLSVDLYKDGEPVKGLVVGNVQSGKTANMAGLMAMAADNGFNYFIILSGVIENLRKQTSSRLYEDMTSSGKGNLHWYQVNNPALKSNISEHNISNFDLSEDSKNRYFTVALKNSTRLNNLIRWLLKDKNKASQLKILVIDDEADQASVNTNKIDSTEETKINHLIKELVHAKEFKAMNYVAYTATPYANILNESGKDSLYPKDFIKILDISEDYIGPEQIFGLVDPERSAPIDIVRDIRDNEKKVIDQLQNGKVKHKLPQSFIDAIHWFLLSSAAMRVINYKKPISMLVHTSFKINHHNLIAEKIEEYLRFLKENYNEILPELEILYKNEKIEFNRSMFLDEMPNYSSKEAVPNYPSWLAVKEQLDYLMRLEKSEFVSHIPMGEEGEPNFHKGIHLVIDNSKAHSEEEIIRLVYPKKSEMPSLAPLFIIVGGNTLSRGLTLEGLTTTYFLRTTNQADTLMQMGRWFGFRKGYEIFPRVWLDRKAYERYTFLAQMNEELKNEILEYAENGLTPEQYAPRVKYSPNQQLIKITSQNKMQGAQPVDFDFSGFNSQTVYFENDKNVLKNNLIVTEKFLNRLPEPELKTKYMVWRHVDSDLIKDFLEKYEVYKKNTKMASLPALVEWIEKYEAIANNWSVVLVSKGAIKSVRDGESDWNIQGYAPNSVIRSKRDSSSNENIAGIGVLRSPNDLLADLESEDGKKIQLSKTPKIAEIRKYRELNGYKDVPQILIYRIDRNSKPQAQGNKPVKHRSPLELPLDPIGINIMIPGHTSSTNIVTYISNKLNFNEELVDEDVYMEEEE